MNERLNELRLDAGISQLHDDPRLVVIDRSGKVIDPLVGLEKFAEMIVRECMEVAGASYTSTPEDCVYYVDLAVNRIAEHFGVEE